MSSIFRAGKAIRSLTKAEQKFFNDVFKNKFDKRELIEEVPSAKLKDNKLEIETKDIDGLEKYIDDTNILEEDRKSIPPSFRDGSFMKQTKPRWMSAPIIEEK